MALTAKQREALCSAPLFKGIPAEQVLRWVEAQGCCCLQFEKDECIVSPQHFEKSLDILLQGKARVRKETADGHAFRMNELHSGQMLGAASLFNTNDTYVSTVTAEEKCTLVRFSQPLLERMFTQDPQIAINYISFLSDRIGFLNRKIESFTGYNALSRVAMYLLDQPKAEVSGSLNALAETLNIGRASLYRALDKLQEMGAICREGKTIRILNYESLMQARKGASE